MNYFSKLFSILLILTSISLHAQIRLPKLISDGAILQRDTELKIWGWATPNEVVEIKFKKYIYKTKADPNGDWSLILPKQKAGGPFKMVLEGKNKITINNILIGEVWLCSGQSNMELTMKRLRDQYPEEIKNSKNKEIRQFLVPDTYDFNQAHPDLEGGGWVEASPETLLDFSGVAYFFAQELYDKYQIPVGLINAAMGGSPVEAWMSEDALKTFDEAYNEMQRFKDPELITEIEQRDKKRQSSWYAQLSEQDKGLVEGSEWFLPDYDDSHWRGMHIPGFWEDQGLPKVDGAVWFRKTIEVPETMVGKEARLWLGRSVDQDHVYVNGGFVGSTAYQYPPRKYEVPRTLLKAGKNSITIRLINEQSNGGFIKDKPYFLSVGKDSLDLKGSWKYRLGTRMKPLLGPTFIRWKPGGLYNAMIAPLTNYKIKGVIWYQGESNTNNPKSYYETFPALVNNWRDKWDIGEFPFIYVQLANFMKETLVPTESNWADLRQAQLKALKLPNTSMVIATDLGEWNDIHPLNKKSIGQRLALGARKLAYGEELVHSGPVFASSDIKGNQIALSFTEVGSGLISNDGKALRQFEIAGEDENFVWAIANIVGNTVVVKNEAIQNPVYARYAWADNPEGANLYNKEGLPASPFRNYDPHTLNSTPWRGKKAAVVLTYDDALNVHLDNVQPLLDSLDLRGTFYVSTYSEAFRNRINDWRSLSEKGHELGNHTLFHPCIGNENRPWVNENYDMGTYTVKRMVDEIKINNTLLEALDGKKNRTFAFTCGDFEVGDGKVFIDELKNELSAARGVRSEMHQIDEIDVYDIDSYPIAGENGDQLIDLVKQAVETNSLLVFLFHGVGGEHSMDVSLPAHKQLVSYLKQNEKEVWTTTLIDAVENIKKNQSKGKTK